MNYKEITSEEYSVLFSKLRDKSFTDDEIGCFLIKDYDKNINKTLYIAIDNTTYDLWTEEFTELDTAISYLKGEVDGEGKPYYINEQVDEEYTDLHKYKTGGINTSLLDERNPKEYRDIITFLKRKNVQRYYHLSDDDKKNYNILMNIELLKQAYEKIDKGLDIYSYDGLERQIAEGMNDILEAQNTLKELVNMKTYTVEIEEVLSRVVEVEATSVEEAQDIVYEQYRNEEIILDDGDYDGMPNIREIK